MHSSKFCWGGLGAWWCRKGDNILVPMPCGARCQTSFLPFLITAQAMRRSRWGRPSGPPGPGSPSHPPHDAPLLRSEPRPMGQASLGWGGARVLRQCARASTRSNPHTGDQRARGGVVTGHVAKPVQRGAGSRAMPSELAMAPALCPPKRGTASRVGKPTPATAPSPRLIRGWGRPASTPTSATACLACPRRWANRRAARTMTAHARLPRAAAPRCAAIPPTARGWAPRTVCARRLRILRRDTRMTGALGWGATRGSRLLCARQWPRRHQRVASPMMPVRTAPRGGPIACAWSVGCRSMRLLPHCASTAARAGRRCRAQASLAVGAPTCAATRAPCPASCRGGARGGASTMTRATRGTITARTASPMSATARSRSRGCVPSG
jgi:hypothetical protein